MKKFTLVLISILAMAGFALAQTGASPSTDVLGAHLNYGRGCAGCHAPHSGARGNGADKSGDATTGNNALWGQDVGNLYGKTLTFGGTLQGTNYSETLPTSMSATTPDVSGILTCLSCHDGNYAQGAMMKNQVYETLPAGYGALNHTDAAGQRWQRHGRLPQRPPSGTECRCRLRRCVQLGLQRDRWQDHYEWS